jgi:hypothetical protein
MLEGGGYKQGIYAVVEGKAMGRNVMAVRSVGLWKAIVAFAELTRANQAGIG